MNRRVFVSQSIVLSCGSMGLPSILNGSNTALHIEESGIKKLVHNRHLTVVSLPVHIDDMVKSLEGNTIVDYSAKAYTYGGNYIVKVDVPGILFKKKGLLFITKDKNYSILDEQYLDKLNDLIISYEAGVKDHNIKSNTAEFIFPYKILNNSSSPFAYHNKYGNTLMIEKVRNRSRFIIT
jgi:hypothetical protein